MEEVRLCDTTLRVASIAYGLSLLDTSTRNLGLVHLTVASVEEENRFKEAAIWTGK